MTYEALKYDTARYTHKKSIMRLSYQISMPIVLRQIGDQHRLQKARYNFKSDYKATEMSTPWFYNKMPQDVKIFMENI